MAAFGFARHGFRFCLPVLLLFGAFGCGGIGDVNGRITYKGKPVAIGSVLLLGKDKVPRQAALRNDGTFSFVGIPAGTFDVAVTSPDPRTLYAPASEKFGSQQPTAPADVRVWIPIPAKAGDPIQSGLKITVNRGPNAVELDINDN